MYIVRFVTHSTTREAGMIPAQSGIASFHRSSHDANLVEPGVSFAADHQRLALH